MEVFGLRVQYAWFRVKVVGLGSSTATLSSRPSPLRSGHAPRSQGVALSNFEPETLLSFGGKT